MKWFAARSDYERLVSPRPLTEYLAASPLAKAVAEGAFKYQAKQNTAGGLFPRDRDVGRDVDFG